MAKVQHSRVRIISGSREFRGPNLTARDSYVHMGMLCKPPAAMRRAAKKSRLSLSEVEEILGLSMEPVENRLAALELAVQMRPYFVPIQSLAEYGLKLTKKIYAVVHPDDECVLASFYDANINTSGETDVEAIEMLKERIATLYQHFATNEHRLGREPARQLAVLRDFIRSN